MDKIMFVKESVIQKNVKVDKDLVEKAEAFEKQLSEFGEQIRPRYTLSHPLSTSKAYFFKQ